MEKNSQKFSLFIGWPLYVSLVNIFIYTILWQDHNKAPSKNQNYRKINNLHDL